MAYQGRSARAVPPAKCPNCGLRLSTRSLIVLGVSALAWVLLATGTAAVTAQDQPASPSPTVLSWPDPASTARGALPRRGWPDFTEFTFSAVVRNKDGIAPSRMFVVIRRLQDARKSVHQATLRLTPSVGDWTTGRLCSATTPLANGTYQYRFSVTGEDGAPATGDPSLWTPGPNLIAVPQLWVTGLPGRTSGFLNKYTGLANETVFRITIQYTDSQDNPALARQIEMQKKGLVGAWEPYLLDELDALDGTPRTGQFFGWASELPAGEYRWRAFFRDEQGTATGVDSIGGDPTDWQDGPVVTEPLPPSPGSAG